MGKTRAMAARFMAMVGIWVFIIGLIFSVKYSKYVQTTATVVKFEKNRIVSEDSERYKYTIRYKAGDKTYQIKDTTNHEYKEGQTISIRYDPEEPLELLGGKKDAANTVVLFGISMTIGCLIYAMYVEKKDE